MELMTALNRLHGGKNIKLPYFIAQLSRYAVPKVLLRSRLEEILRDGEKRMTWTMCSTASITTTV